MTERMLLLTAAAILISQIALAHDEYLKMPQTEAERRDRVGLALDFTQCAGLSFAAADIGKERGLHPDNIQLSEGIGRALTLPQVCSRLLE